MHIRRNKKKRKDGSERTEIAIAHNVRVTAGDGTSVTKPVVIARLGHEDDVDLEAVDDMIAALTRYRAKRASERAETGQAKEAPAQQAVAIRESITPRAGVLKVVASRQLGVRVIIEEVWRDLGLRQLFRDIEQASSSALDFERLVFAMVVNRLTDPMSKRACDAWVRDAAYFPEASEWSVDHFYAAMDVLDANGKSISDHVLRMVMARVPEAERKRLLLDTTNLFTESSMDDVERAEVAASWEAYLDGKSSMKPVDPKPQVVNEPPLRMRGHSKEGKSGAPLVTIGLLTTQKGTVLWHDVQSGNASEKKVTRDLVTEVITRHPDQEVVCVMDSGMSSRPNLKWLSEQNQGRVGWLVGVPVRQSPAVDELLKKRGAWKRLSRRAPEGPWLARVVEIPEDERIDPTRPERLIVLRNPSRARRDWRKLDRDLTQVKTQLSRDSAPAPKGAVARRLGNANRSRLLKWNGEKRELGLDREAVKMEHRRLGVRAMRTTIMDLSADETISAYDELLRLEDDFRTFKSPLKIRPMHHRASRRIRAHAMLIFLAVACMQEVTRRTGRRWSEVKESVRAIDAVQMSQSGGLWWQRTGWDPEVDEILAALGIAEVPERWASNAGFRVRRVAPNKSGSPPISATNGR